MVIVIGAGMAGLAAARELHAAGREVVVLEARDRLGGRVHTDRTAGRAIELGAMWIHGSVGNPIAALTRQVGGRTIEAHHTAGLVGPLSAHEEMALGPDRDPMRSFEDILSAADELAAQESQDMPVERAVRRVPGAPAPLLEWGLRWHALIMGRELDALSAKQWHQDDDVPGPDLVSLDGHDRVIDALADGLDVRLRHVVGSVATRGPRVHVETSRGTFDAEAVIVTLPLGVLQHGTVRFDPPLPKDKREALQSLGMGVLDRVVLSFGEVAWPDDREHLGVAAAREDEIFGFTNLARYGMGPILVGWFAGEGARRLEALDDGELVRRATAPLSRALGRALPEPTAVHVTRWASDPFARGAYSHIPVGSHGECYDRVAAPVGGRLLFAGEATHRRHPATLHGAYLSGIREARRWLAR